MSRQTPTLQMQNPNPTVTLAAKSPKAASASAGLRHEAIAKRAFEKWKSRGCRNNTALQDWFEAEAEIRAEIHKSR